MQLICSIFHLYQKQLVIFGSSFIGWIKIKNKTSLDSAGSLVLFLFAFPLCQSFILICEKAFEFRYFLFVWFLSFMDFSCDLITSTSYQFIRPWNSIFLHKLLSLSLLYWIYTQKVPFSFFSSLHWLLKFEGVEEWRVDEGSFFLFARTNWIEWKLPFQYLSKLRDARSRCRVYLLKLLLLIPSVDIVILENWSSLFVGFRLNSIQLPAFLWWWWLCVWLLWAELARASCCCVAAGICVSGTKWGVRLEIDGNMGLEGHW